MKLISQTFSSQKRRTLHSLNKQNKPSIVTIVCALSHSVSQASSQGEPRQAKTRVLYRCPFCRFKSGARLAMRRHLAVHFRGAQAARLATPVYRCSLCPFRSKWQFFVKRHITAQHLGVRSAYVLRYPARSPASYAETEAAPASPRR